MKEGGNFQIQRALLRSCVLAQQRAQPPRRNRKFCDCAGHADSIVDRSGDRRADRVDPPSPAPLKPIGLSGLGASSEMMISTAGISRNVGIR